MAEKKVDFQKLIDFSIKAKSMSSNVRGIGQRLYSMKNSLDWEI